MSKLFPNIGEDIKEGPDEIESVCMNCQENGMTRLLLTSIPFFKEVVLSSFTCDHCNFRNNEVQPSGVIQKKGIRYTIKIDGQKDMARQVVKQSSAMFRIVELGFEAPEFTSSGSLTTVEGLFQNAIDGLKQQQPIRLIMNPELAAKIDTVIENLTKYKTGEVPFTLVLEDCSGNSFVENPYAPKADPNCKQEEFTRTPEQNEKLGLAETDEEEFETSPPIEDDEVVEFPTNCQSCNGPAPTKMKKTQIPHFKEVIIMATNCESCGYKSNEVRVGGAISEKGTSITFNMTDVSDLQRDVLTSESCSISIPEIDLKCRLSSNGGKFTTLEGIFTLVLEHLGTIAPFQYGDSSQKSTIMANISQTVTDIKDGKKFTKIIFDDPLGNSYLQNIYAPDDDPEMTIEYYTRSHDQDEEYGLLDMKTENYT